jgi:hypothetical protein
MRTSLVTLVCIITLLANSVKAELHVLEHSSAGSTSVSSFRIDQHQPLLSTSDSSKSSAHQTQSCKCGDCYYPDLMPSQLFIVVPDLFQFVTECGSETNNCQECSHFRGLAPQTLFRPPKSS